MSPRPLIEEIRKAHILEATLKAIADRGAASLTMRQVAKATAVSGWPCPAELDICLQTCLNREILGLAGVS